MAGETGGTTNRLLNSLQYAMANVAADVSTAATNDLFPIADVSDDYEIKWADGANVLEACGITATAAEINAAADNASRIVNVTDAATYTVLAADSRKTHIIPDLTATCTLTLPAPTTAGLEYVFISKAIAADAQNWVFVSPGSVAILGATAFADTDAGAGADEIHLGVYGNGSSNDTFTIVTPAAGTRVYLVSDGTNWILNAQVFSATVPTIADT